MLRLGRPVGVFPRLEAHLAAIRIGRQDAEVEEGETGCAECGGVSEEAQEVHECSSSDNGTVRGDSSSSEDEDCGCPN